MEQALSSGDDAHGSLSAEGAAVVIVVTTVSRIAGFMVVIGLRGWLGTLELLGAGRAIQPLVADLHEAVWQDVLEQACDEILIADGAALGLSGLVVTVAKGHLPIFVALEAAVDDGDAMDIAG